MKSTLVNLRVKAKELARWKAQAKKQGISLSDWVRRNCAANSTNALEQFTKNPKVREAFDGLVLDALRRLKHGHD